MKIVSQAEIRNLGITPRQCVEWVYQSFSIKPRAELPAKISCHPGEMNFFTSMPCLLPETEDGNLYFGVKEVHRIQGAIPSLGSDILLYDAKDGKILALMDCDWITAMRTGAVAAVAAKTLRTDGSSRYGLIGLGNTARASMLCILDNEPEKHFDVTLLRYKDQAEQFIHRFDKYDNVSFRIVDNVNEMVSSVDVFISCITSASTLIVEDESLFKPGITLIPVHTRGFQNCDLTFDRVLCDDTNHVKGFKYFSKFKGYNEIGEVLAGRDPGRTSNEQRIISYNVGLALHDVLFASKIFTMLEGREILDVEICKETDKFWI